MRERVESVCGEESMRMSVCQIKRVCEDVGMVKRYQMLTVGRSVGGSGVVWCARGEGVSEVVSGQEGV